MLGFSMNLPERKVGRIIMIECFRFDDIMFAGGYILCRMFLWMILGIYKLGSFTVSVRGNCLCM